MMANSKMDSCMVMERLSMLLEVAMKEHSRMVSELDNAPWCTRMEMSIEESSKMEFETESVLSTTAMDVSMKEIGTTTIATDPVCGLRHKASRSRNDHTSLSHQIFSHFPKCDRVSLKFQKY